MSGTNQAIQLPTDFVEEIRSTLEADLVQLRAQIDHAPDSGADPSGTATGQGETEHVNTEVERRTQEAIEATSVQALEEISGALARLADGTYGMCVECGTEIGADRLRALPRARKCIGCQGRTDRVPRR